MTFSYGGASLSSDTLHTDTKFKKKLQEQHRVMQGKHRGREKTVVGALIATVYRVAHCHKVPYLHISFSAKEPYD